jgi:hypothetical protein
MGKRNSQNTLIDPGHKYPTLIYMWTTQSDSDLNWEKNVILYIRSDMESNDRHYCRTKLTRPASD